MSWQRRERLAETLARYKTADSARHLEMCRQIADDLELAGADRMNFLRKAEAC